LFPGLERKFRCTGVNMKIKNLLPKNFVEHEYFKSMLKHLSGNVFDKKTIIITHDRRRIPQDGDDVVVILVSDDKGKVPKYASKVMAVFKHYLDEDHIDNTYHIPLTFVKGFTGNASIPILNREYDLVFIGRVHESRKSMWEAANKWAKEHPSKKCLLCDSGSKFNSGLPIDMYSDYMRRAKVVLAPAGANNSESFRFTEAVKCGSVIISDPLPDLHVFRDCPAIYTDWTDLDEIMRSLNKKKMGELSKEMQGCWRKYFSPRAVGQYISRTVRHL